MLVLTRKLGEIVRVGEAITVRVLEVKGNQVRLGVEAPADVRISRGGLPRRPEGARSSCRARRRWSRWGRARVAQSARRAL